MASRSGRSQNPPCASDVAGRLEDRGVLEWDYANDLGKIADQAIGAMREQLSDDEITAPIGELKAFPTGANSYNGLDAETRRGQLPPLATAAADFHPWLCIVLSIVSSRCLGTLKSRDER